MPTHAEKRFLPYTPDQLFDLVIGIDRYPEFLPWCLGCRIRRREGDDLVVADMIIGFKMFRETFTSRVRSERPDLIHVSYEDGPFKYLNNHWKFIPAEGGTEIDFYVDFEFRSRVLQAAIGAVFNEAVKKMIAAFEKRAHELYG